MAMKNVKVIDADTIDHKGKLYSKLGEVVLAKKGDLIQRKDTLMSWFSDNSFYKIKLVDSAGDVIVKDDTGDFTSFCRHHGVLFRKVTKPDKQKLKAGDFVTIDIEYVGAEITQGKVYKIYEDASGIYILDDAGDRRQQCLYRGAYTIVDAEEAKWAAIGRKVNEARVGDIVQASKDDNAKPVGTIFKVASVYEGISQIKDEHSNYYTLGTNVKLIAPVEATFK